MSLADRALFSDLVIFQNENEAMGNSFQAADRLLSETDVAFAGAFVYVVNIRHAVVKSFDPNYFCSTLFQEEFRRYVNRLNRWIRQLDDLIDRSHTVSLDIGREAIDRWGQRWLQYWRATHFRDGVVVGVFRGRLDDTSTAEHNAVERRAEASRQQGIEADRNQFGVVELEKTAAAWAEPFDVNLRLALVNQILNRSMIAADSNPKGLMVDGRILRADLDQRSSLVELLISREFHDRIQKSWSAFVRRNDDRLAQFAHRRLFDRDATDEEVTLLRTVALNYGYHAFIATLLYSTQYEERFGRGLPNSGPPIADALSRSASRASRT